MGETAMKEAYRWGKEDSAKYTLADNPFTFADLAAEWERGWIEATTEREALEVAVAR